MMRENPAGLKSKINDGLLDPIVFPSSHGSLDKVWSRFLRSGGYSY